MAGLAGATELDQPSAFEGALKWMEEGGVNIWLGFCALDVFQLEGGGRVWGMEGDWNVHDRFVKPATCTNGGHSHNIVIINKGAI